MKLIFAIALFVLSLNCFAGDIYLSQAGNDKFPGTRKQLKLTLSAARDAMRQTKNKGAIILRGGNYRLSETLELNQADSGVIFKAYSGEDVSITGGASVPWSACKPVRDPEVLDRLPESSRDKV